jgi:hypothetical protein
MITDVTMTLKRAHIPWQKSVREIESFFDPWLRQTTRGLYIQYFENNGTQPVYDKNRGFRDGRRGALVVHAQGMSIKSGKFERGFLRRRKQDADHLHHIRAEKLGETYRSCLKFAFLLDLTDLPRFQVSGLREAERVLKRNVDRIIDVHSALRPKATRQGDWRRLGLKIPSLRASMRRCLEQTEQELVVRKR